MFGWLASRKCEDAEEPDGCYAEVGLPVPSVLGPQEQDEISPVQSPTARSALRRNLAPAEPHLESGGDIVSLTPAEVERLAAQNRRAAIYLRFYLHGEAAAQARVRELQVASEYAAIQTRVANSGSATLVNISEALQEIYERLRPSCSYHQKFGLGASDWGDQNDVQVDQSTAAAPGLG